MLNDQKRLKHRIRMEKSNKKNLLILSLFLTAHPTICDQNNDQSFFAALMQFVFGNQQHQPQKQQNEQAPEGVTVDDYITQLRYDLNGAYHPNKTPVIPWKEIDAIEQSARVQLRNTNLRDRDRVNQKIGSVLIDHVEKQTILTLDSLARQGYQLNVAEQRAIRESMGRNIATRLEEIPHLNGEALHQFFGQELVDTITQRVKNATYQNVSQPTYYHRPTPSAPPVDYKPRQQTPTTTYATTTRTTKPSTSKPVGHSTKNRNDWAQQHGNAIEQALAGSGLPINDIKRLKQLTYDSSAYIQYIEPENFLAHAKNGLAQFLDEKLEQERNTLKSEIIDTSKLHKSIEETRQQIIAEITQLSQLDKTKLRRLFSDTNLQEKILENMPAISCPVCLEFFKQEHRHGQVDKVILKAAHHGASCGHAVCKTCIPGCRNTCPLCRAAIDQQDLNNKLRTTDASFR